jgi:hypothetical protein
MGQIERIERRLKPHDMRVRLRRQLVRIEQSENRPALESVAHRAGGAVAPLRGGGAGQRVHQPPSVSGALNGAGPARGREIAMEFSAAEGVALASG